MIGWGDNMITKPFHFGKFPYNDKTYRRKANVIYFDHVEKSELEITYLALFAKFVPLRS